MSRLELFLTNWLTSRNNISPNQIDRNANILEEGYIDSLGIFILIADLESEFGLNIEEKDLMDKRFTTIAGLTDIMCEKTKGS